MTGDGTRLLIEASPGQRRAMLYEAGRVTEAWHDFDHDPDLTGSVHRVRVDRVFPAQNRATARLADGSAISIRTSRHDRLAAGGLVSVTITAARREDKPWQAVPGAAGGAAGSPQVGQASPAAILSGSCWSGPCWSGLFLVIAVPRSTQHSGLVTRQQAQPACQAPPVPAHRAPEASQPWPAAARS